MEEEKESYLSIGGLAERLCVVGLAGEDDIIGQSSSPLSIFGVGHHYLAVCPLSLPFVA